MHDQQTLHASNKPIKSGSLSSTALESGSPSPLLEPSITPLLDKISVCLDYPDPAHRHAIRLELYNCAKDTLTFLSGAKGKHYRIGLRALIRDKNKYYGEVLIQADPKKPEAPFLRFEWNPQHLGFLGHILIL